MGLSYKKFESIKIKAVPVYGIIPRFYSNKRRSHGKIDCLITKKGDILLLFLDILLLFLYQKVNLAVGLLLGAKLGVPHN